MFGSQALVDYPVEHMYGPNQKGIEKGIEWKS